MFKKYALITTFLVLFKLLYADDFTCNFYAKFVKNTSGGYLIESASSSYIDSSNVLQVLVDSKTNNVLALEVPSTNNAYIGAIKSSAKNANSNCSLAYSNKGKLAICEGDFVKSDKTGAVVMNSFLTVITVGIGTAASGGIYSTSPDIENIKIAKESSDILNSSITKSYFENCKTKYNTFIIQKQKEQDSQNAKSQAQSNSNLACKSLISNLNTINITGKQIMDAVNDAGYSCQIPDFATECNKLSLDETISKIGKKNCSVGVHNACIQYKNSIKNAPIIFNNGSSPCDSI